MRRAFVFVLCLALIPAVLRAGDDRPIKTEQLPADARRFVAEYFPDEQVALAKVDKGWFDREYKVIFTSGTTVEFDRNGRWKEVDCRYAVLPERIVPRPIRDYIASHYPETSPVKIERDRDEWEVRLTNRLELTFDARFNLIDIDD